MTNDKRKLGQKWLKRLTAAEKREDEWLKTAEEAETAFSGLTKDTSGKVYDFNILHSNVQTIAPSLYNSTPAPDIRDRFGAGDEVAKAVADVYERLIAAEIDDNRLDQEIEAEIQDALIAGRGVVRVRFDADVEEIEEVTEIMQTPDIETGEYMESEIVVSEARQEVSEERITFEVVPWRCYRQGVARRHSDVPWVAFEHAITEEDLEELCDDDLVASQTTESDEAISDDEEDTIVWEVWDKNSKTVLFVRESDGVILKEDDDPLGLKGFFPIPAPLMPISLVGKLTPIVPFSIYKKLADELDSTTKRINKITAGLKVRGIIAAGAENIARLSELGDNELLPVTDLESLANTRGLDAAISWWPIETAIQVLQHLYQSRELTKQVIYEVTGISDIVRGASQTSETATAQQIKTQWGSLRLKKMQNEVQRQVRDIFVMMTEIISANFSTETIQTRTGIEVTPEMEQLLRDPIQRYRIDVESDSTIKADLSRMKGELGEFLNGTSTYMATMGPVIQQAPGAAEPVMQIYSSFARLFNLGKQGEDAIEQLVKSAKEAASNPPPNPDAEAAQAEGQIKQQELQMKQMELQGRGQLELQKLQMSKEQHAVEMQIKQAELGIKQAEVVLKERQLEIEGVSRLAEMELEEEQERPVRIGDG